LFSFDFFFVKGADPNLSQTIRETWIHRCRPTKTLERT
jgi:hypothetical protein